MTQQQSSESARKSSERKQSDDKKGYPLSVIDFAGCARNAQELAETLKLTDITVHDGYDVVIGIHPVDHIRYLHFVFSGVTVDFDYSHINPNLSSELYEPYHGQLANCTVDSLSDIGYQFLYQALTSDAGIHDDDTDSIIETIEVSATEFEQTLIETGVLIVTGDYDVPDN